MVDTTTLLYRSLLTLLLTAACVAGTAPAPRGRCCSSPFDLLPLAGGKYLVTDMSANAVYEVDPARHTGRLVARVAQARELGRVSDGRVLVTSAEKVLALNLRTGKATVFARAKNYLLGISPLPGRLAVRQRERAWERADDTRPHPRRRPAGARASSTASTGSWSRKARA